MKNILKTLLLIFVLSATVVYAEESIEKKTTVDIDVHIGNIENFKFSYAQMALYNMEREQLGVVDLRIDAVNVTKQISFEIDEYTAGEEFYLSCLSNADCIEYESEFYGVDSKILLKTKNDSYDENSQIIKGNLFGVNLYPIEQNRISIKRNSQGYVTQHPVKLIDGITMISLVDVMDMFRLWQDKTLFDDLSGKLEIYCDDKTIGMTLWSGEASNGEEIVTIAPPTRVNSLMYVPLRFTCEALGAEVNATTLNSDIYINIVANVSEFPEKDDFINSQNIGSRTDYLIWIDKSDFAVTVFKGSWNNWTAINSYPCSIGAPGTPTITGKFEYFSKENRWSYPGYYCGPIMRFYRGYAMHSTLIRYDGTDYDGRLGKRISHGCVRMRPADIQYLWDTIPLYTRVYVTE